MAKEGQKKYRDALEQAKREFAKRDFRKMVELAGATACDQSSFLLPYGRELYRVEYPTGEVYLWEEQRQEKQDKQDKVEITDHILILQYLTEVCGVVPTGRWISFRELPGGNNHYETFRLEAMVPLAQRFGNAPEDFAGICQEFKGKKLSMGDVSYAIPVFPKLEIALILWLADDEFPAQANILYDANASMHLNTEGLEVMAINLVEKMLNS